jgi:glycosyltransferase involved in cell wall biosynthesis
MSLSVIVPLYNERENVEPLYRELLATLEGMGTRWEVLLVDDGSADGTGQEAGRLAATDQRITLIQFRRNYGQTAAIQAGLEAAEGDTIVLIDGDLQNDPRDIPAMLERLDQGADLVCGIRAQRQDQFLRRKLPSRIANRLIGWSTGVPIRDLGCTLKAMRRDVADELDLYGEMHRFIPILAHARGARVAQCDVHHRPRLRGTSKYGLSRTTRVLLDLLVVMFLLRYLDRPMKLIGRFALWALAGSMLSGTAVLLMKIVAGSDMTGNPMLMLTVLLALMSTQLFGLGLLGELNCRLYYQRSQRRPFAIRQATPSPGSPQTRSTSIPRRAA